MGTLTDEDLNAIADLVRTKAAPGDCLTDARRDEMRPLRLSGGGDAISTKLVDAITGEDWSVLYSARLVSVEFMDGDSWRPKLIVELRPRLVIDIDTDRLPTQEQSAAICEAEFVRLFATGDEPGLD